MPETHPLVTAYHAAYDIKDAVGPSHPAWTSAYDACRALSALMSDIGVEAPVRFDSEHHRPRPLEAPRKDQS